ncbi:MAG TPA: hypothetical protein ENG32_00925 [bacterium]|nr:hypothetical protein [bacterium]
MEEEIVLKAKENYLKEGFSCGEAIVKAIKEAKIIEVPEEIIKVASPFKTGIGKKNDFCGALLGGIVLIGLRYGRSKKEESPEKAIKLAAKLYEEFEKEFGDVRCQNLLKEFIEKDALESKERKNFCAERFISFVTKKLIEILKEEN